MVDMMTDFRHWLAANPKPDYTFEDAVRISADHYHEEREEAGCTDSTATASAGPPATPEPKADSQT